MDMPVILFIVQKDLSILDLNLYNEEHSVSLSAFYIVYQSF